MKHYEFLLQVGSFTRSQLAEYLNSDTAATDLILRFMNKGLIERVKHNLYAVISIETRMPVLTNYEIVTRVSNDAILCGMAVFDLLKLTKNPIKTINIYSNFRFNDFIFNETYFHRISRPAHIRTIFKRGISTTTLERAFLDSLSLIKSRSDITDLSYVLSQIKKLDEEILIEELKHINNQSLYQKCGYFLSEYGEHLFLSQNFYDHCKKYLNTRRVYLVKGIEKVFYSREWRVYFPISNELY